MGLATQLSRVCCCKCYVFTSFMLFYQLNDLLSISDANTPSNQPRNKLRLRSLVTRNQKILYSRLLKKIKNQTKKTSLRSKYPSLKTKRTIKSSKTKLAQVARNLTSVTHRIAARNQTRVAHQTQSLCRFSVATRTPSGIKSLVLTTKTIGD